jgi:hypothetical protein
MAVAVFIDLMALFTYYDGCSMNPTYCACDTVDGNSCLGLGGPIVYFSPCEPISGHGTVFYDLFNMNKNN